MKIGRKFDRMYENLSAKEKVLLVFEHLRQGNIAEADRVSDQVPMKAYRIPDPEYTDLFENLRRVVLYFSMEYWRYRAGCNAAFCGLIYIYYCDPEEVSDAFCEWLWQSAKRWETNLLSLDSALDTLCEKEKIDPALLRHFATIDRPYQSLGFGEVDPVMVTEMVEKFGDVLREKS